jgi:hypothetical protein
LNENFSKKKIQEFANDCFIFTNSPFYFRDSRAEIPLNAANPIHFARTFNTFLRMQEKIFPFLAEFFPENSVGAGIQRALWSFILQVQV